MKIILYNIFLLLFLFSTQYSYSQYSQWSHIDGFSQGNLTALCTFDDGYIGVTSYDNGFYASFNNGLLWTMQSYYPNFHFYSIFPGPYLSHIFLAGTDHGIYFSNNGGKIWQEMSYTNDTVYCFKRKNNNYIYAGSSSHLYYGLMSAPAPTSFNKTVTGIEIMNSTIIVASNDNIYYSSDNNIWNSSDFQQKAFTLSSLNNKVFAGGPYGIYYSTNEGHNWASTTLHNNNFYKWDIGTAGNNLIAYSSAGIYVSTNEGVSWLLRSTFTPGNNFTYDNGIAYIPSDKGKIFYSNDNGLSWSLYNLNNGSVASLTYKPGLLCAGTDMGYTGTPPSQESGLYHSSDLGNSWVQFSGFQSKNMFALASNNNMILAAYDEQWGGLKGSTNNGLSWLTMNLSVQWGVYSLSFKGNSDTVFAGVSASQGIRKSVDAGNNWMTMSFNGYNISDFVFLKDKIFIGTSTSSPNRGVFVSSDQGLNWNKTGFDSIDVYAIEAAGSRLFAATGIDLYYSDNFGNNWTQVNFQFICPTKILALDSLNILIGTYGNGIFITTNSGLTWNRKNEGFYNEYNYIAKFIKAENYIFCGTYFGGLWKRPVSDFIGIKEDEEIVPENYSLQQNYPNPFNSSTIIKYSVCKASDISIKIYDISGREIKTLVNEYKSPGNYQVSLSGENLTSGVYFYQLEAKAYSETKKMVLIK